MKNRQLIAVVLLLAFAAVARFLPHPPNFSPVTAMAFLSGALLSHRLAALVLPLFFVFLTDLVIGFYPGQWVVYLAYIAVGAIGLVQANHKSSKTLWVANTLLSAIAFFLVSNLSVWLTGTMYAKNLAGLIQCYVMAIPFFPSTLISHILFVVALGAAYKWAMEPLAGKLSTQRV